MAAHAPGERQPVRELGALLLGRLLRPAAAVRREQVTAGTVGPPGMVPGCVPTRLDVWLRDASAAVGSGKSGTPLERMHWEKAAVRSAWSSWRQAVEDATLATPGELPAATAGREQRERGNRDDRGEGDWRRQRMIFGSFQSREGKATSIPRPPPARACAVTVASWASAIACTIARPSPTPSPKALGFGVESLERLEETRELAGRDHRPGVGDRERRRAPRGVGYDVEPAAGNVVTDAFVTRLATRRSTRLRITGRPCRVERHVAFEPAQVVSSEHFGRDHGEVDRLAPLRPALAPGKGETSLEQPLLLPAGAEDVLADLSPARHIRVRVGKCQLEEGTLGRQGRTQLVRHIGGEGLPAPNLAGESQSPFNRRSCCRADPPVSAWCRSPPRS